MSDESILDDFSIESEYECPNCQHKGYPAEWDSIRKVSLFIDTPTVNVNELVDEMEYIAEYLANNDISDSLKVQEAGHLIKSQKTEIEQLRCERDTFKESSELTLDSLRREDQLEFRVKELENVIRDIQFIIDDPHDMDPDGDGIFVNIEKAIDKSGVKVDTSRY